MKITDIVNEDMDSINRHDRPQSNPITRSHARDPELLAKQQFARSHYSGYANDPESAFDKWVQRSLMHSEEDDEKNAAMLTQLQAKISNVEKQISNLRQTKN
jgi:hypothetical protein